MCTGLEDTKPVCQPQQLTTQVPTEVRFDHRAVKALKREAEQEVSFRNEYPQASEELPLEGHSGEDNCSNTQRVSAGLNAIQNEGHEGASRPKMAAQRWEQRRRRRGVWGEAWGNAAFSADVLRSNSVPRRHGAGFDTLKHVLIKNPHAASLPKESICLITSCIHHKQRALSLDTASLDGVFYSA